MRKAATYRDWQPGVSLDIPELDADHQRLLARVNGLLAAVATAELAVVKRALRDLRSEAEDHFRREEALMREAQYPDLRQHCVRHQRLLHALGPLRLALGTAERIGVPLVPMNFVRRWFTAHITRDDRRVASFLEGKEEKFLFGLA